ncbi:MAG: hypothetical protein B7X47_04910 [Ferrovum sp. 34-44-207]|nr:MAG: hypothetical protein B7X47_04910 [Ferrovum sp. 34-44-207]
MCRLLNVHRSDYYAWKARLKSKWAVTDEALLIDVKQSLENSYDIYGRARIHRNLLEAGTRCDVKRVARLHGGETLEYV